MGQVKLFNGKASGEAKGSYYLVKLTNEVSYPQSTVEGIRNLVAESDDLYPGIEVWFQHKVIPGIREGRRYAYLVMHEGKAIAEAIVKRASDTKICSMRIRPAYQNKAIGTILFAQIASLLEESSTQVHFTAPESLVEEREGMFQALGFMNVGRALKRYRVGQEEFVFRGERNNFRRRAVRLLAESEEAKATEEQDVGPIVLSVKPKFAQKIISHKKTVEVRRKFSKKIVGSTVFIYATKPQQSVVGEATVASVIEGSPREIWEIYRGQLGCTRQEYDDYCKGIRFVNAVVFKEVFPYADPLPWNVFTAAFDALIKPPQSYQFLRPSGFTSAGNYRLIEPSEFKKHEAEQISLF
jgi:predicted transcriptional regulator/N-acetylglutamate synthase-like GNAT family acetyltransferase